MHPRAWVFNSSPLPAQNCLKARTLRQQRCIVLESGELVFSYNRLAQNVEPFWITIKQFNTPIERFSKIVANAAFSIV